MENFRLNQNVKIDFSPAQMAIIIESLSKQPYDKVADLMVYIRTQVLGQIKKEITEK